MEFTNDFYKSIILFSICGVFTILAYYDMHLKGTKYSKMFFTFMVAISLISIVAVVIEYIN